MTCFTDVGLDVPTTAGDCVCGEFVRFDLVFKRTEHFMVCPAVDAAIAEHGIPDNIDEAAVKVGMGLAGYPD